MPAGDPPLLLIVAPTGRVTGYGAGLEGDTSIGDDALAWPGMAALLDAVQDGGAAVATVDLPGLGPVEVVAHVVRTEHDEATQIVVTDAPVAVPDADDLARARHLVEEADRVLQARDAELAELRSLAEQLLEAGPIIAVLDERRRIRGWSSRAVSLWSVPVDRAMGQPLATVLAGLDLRTLGRVRHVDSTEGVQRIVVESLDPDERLVLVRLLESATRRPRAADAGGRRPPRAPRAS